MIQMWFCKVNSIRNNLKSIFSDIFYTNLSNLKYLLSNVKSTLRMVKSRLIVEFDALRSIYNLFTVETLDTVQMIWFFVDSCKLAEYLLPTDDTHSLWDAKTVSPFTIVNHNVLLQNYITVNTFDTLMMVIFILYPPHTLKYNWFVTLCTLLLL